MSGLTFFCLAPPLADSSLSVGFWAGMWQGVFQLLALAIVAVWVKGVWQRFRERHSARRELIDEIDRFSVSLYSPRKLYQTLIEGADEEILKCLPEGEPRERERVRVLRDSLDGLIEAIGRFRALQVKVVPLYGFHVEIFAHYVAIWMYLKEMRERMRRMETLHHRPDAERQSDGGGDDLYRLIDAFRFHIMTQRAKTHPPRKMHLAKDFLDNVNVLANKLYRHYFGVEPSTAIGTGQAKAKPPSAESNGAAAVGEAPKVAAPSKA